MVSQLSPLFPSGLNFHALNTQSASTIALATVGTVVIASTAWIVRDYNQWISFGSGGTPPTPYGYLRMTKFRWRRFWSTDDLRDPTPLSSEGSKYLSQDLPYRLGERPAIVARTMPQRQKPEPLDAAISDRLHNIPKKYCNEYSRFLVLDLSKTEGRTTDAIYAKSDLPGRDPSANDKVIGNEIAHVHPADNSLHVWLSSPDAKQVVEKGWGERFPLSSLGMLHSGWIMLYAPRNMEQLDMIEEIVKAGIGFLTGERL